MHEFLSTPPKRRIDDSLVVEQSQAFEAFDGWMDGQLDTLVARWLHMAAPNANRPWRATCNARRV